MGILASSLLVVNSHQNNKIILPLVLTLPIAYSRFNEITQGDLKLHARPNHAGLTQVKVDNISAAVISVYRHPVVITIISGVSAIILFFLFVYRYLICNNNRQRVI